MENTPSSVLLACQKIVSSSRSDTPVLERRWQEIVAHYAQTHRHYHTLDHIASLIDTLHLLGKEEPASTLVLAAIYHDIIYDTKRSDNEEKSAVLCTEALNELGMSSELANTVPTLILCTKKHEPATLSSELNQQSAIFLDADLFILAAPEAMYDRYRQQIRDEYNWVSETNFRSTRASILKRFLERDHIFFSEAAAPFESQARSNLEREISELES